MQRSGGFMKKAFTLAEVLITLGIIGIVAAMTLPTVINNIQDKQFRTMFKKQYSIINQALLMTYESGDDIPNLDQSNWKDMIFYVCRIAKQLKYTDSGLKCAEIEAAGESAEFESQYSNSNVTWHKEGEWYNKKGEPQALNLGYEYMTFMLPDGVMINFSCLRDVFVDVNGMRKPNTIGRDIFYFYIPQGKLYPSFFYKRDGLSMVNACTGSYGVSITRENYKQDCESGTGWGCSPMYILD